MPTNDPSHLPTLPPHRLSSSLIPFVIGHSIQLNPSSTITLRPHISIITVDNDRLQASLSYSSNSRGYHKHQTEAARTDLNRDAFGQENKVSLGPVSSSIPSFKRGNPTPQSNYSLTFFSLLSITPLHFYVTDHQTQPLKFHRPPEFVITRTTYRHNVSITPSTQYNN